MRLVQDNPSSLSLVEIYKQRCAKKGIEHDNPISRYYDRLATVQARGTQASHQVPGREGQGARCCFHGVCAGKGGGALEVPSLEGWTCEMVAVRWSQTLVKCPLLQTICHNKMK